MPAALVARTWVQGHRKGDVWKSRRARKRNEVLDGAESVHLNPPKLHVFGGKRRHERFRDKASTLAAIKGCLAFSRRFESIALVHAPQHGDLMQRKAFFAILFASSTLACGPTIDVGQDHPDAASGADSGADSEGDSTALQDTGPERCHGACVTLNSQMEPGSLSGVNEPAQCQLVAPGPWVVIGDFNPRNGGGRPISNGDSQSGSLVEVTCAVRPEGDGFNVTANARLQGQGSVTITGHVVGEADVTPPTQAGITATFERPDTGTFQDANCTMDFSSNPIMGLAPGRVWGQITCPRATFGAQGRTCSGAAEFRFENCAQH